MARSASGDSLLTRVMRVLEVFAQTPSPSIADVARGADLPVSTAHRLVHEMIGHGLLERDDERRLRMGVRLWELSVRSHRVLGLRDVALPYMEDLRAVVHQDVEIAVLAGTEVLYIERLGARGAVPNIARTAERLPAHSTSAGLVLLAHAPAELREPVLTGPLEAFTPQTVTDPAALRRTLATVRRQGYAVAPGLLTPGAKGVAVPLRDATGAVVAALSVIVPMREDHRSLLPALLATGRGISRGLGSTFPGHAASDDAAAGGV